MESAIRRTRKPVKRGDAEQYLVITLLSFAASVILIPCSSNLPATLKWETANYTSPTYCGAGCCCSRPLSCLWSLPTAGCTK
jgi:hypothetical protein